MEKYVVSARKYRPAKFEDVVGQEHITNTLRNALKNNQLAHAFLFCGPRGVGKTTCARILAKVINCLNPTPEMEACESCRSCLAFNETTSFNIYELDAASNNSVEDIRGLIEQVRIPPQGGKFKVYIIDEVHMLTSAAFNAFLKTLEEPPSYAKFILATTERHKILPTILSRCQVFDFNRIKPDSIVQQLRKIAIDRNVSADDDSLHLIAQKADGGLRDALSLFDKMANFCSGNIVLSEVLEQLNILDADFYFKLTESMLTEDVGAVLTTFQAILQKGFEGDTLLMGLGEHFRNLLVGKEVATLQLLEVSENVRKKYIQQSTITPASFLLSALNLINESDINYRMSKNKRLHVELLLIRLCYLNATIKNFAVQAEKKKTTDPITAAYEPGVTTSTAGNPTMIKPVVQLPKTVVPTSPSAPAGGSHKPLSSATANTSVNLKGIDLGKMKELAAQQAVERKIQEPKQEEKIEQVAASVVQGTPTAIPAKEKPYTPMQKFDAMTAKNPKLIELMKTLRLDVEW